MCLLIHKPAAVQFTEEELRDFYTRNSDGYGVMYAEGGTLHYAKELGSVEQWLSFYGKHAHREMCIHLRMRTHGDVDLENCHPYPVFGFPGSPTASTGLALMHNGILSTGNSADTKRSDTWHYIRDYLHVILKGEPAFFRTRRFKDLIGKHIGGNNRFALMDGEGHVTIINRDTGVEYKGAWLSNTYAWSALKFMPRPKYEPSMYQSGSMNKSYHDWKTSNAQYLKDWQDKSKGGAEIKKPVTGTSAVPKAGTGKPKVHRKPKQKELLPMDNGTTLISREWVEDVLEIRSLLDAAYPANTTRDKQIEYMCKTVGYDPVYKMIELMFGREFTDTQWDAASTNTTELRALAQAVLEATTEDDDHEPASTTVVQ